jgi:two-component system cell cycle sensor histidine kinase/response regulator CckA
MTDQASTHLAVDGTEAGHLRGFGWIVAVMLGALLVAGGSWLALHDAGSDARSLAWPVAGLILAFGAAAALAIRLAVARAVVAAERLADQQARLMRRSTHAEAEAAAERDRLRSYLDTMPVGAFVCGDDGTLLYVNECLAGWLGRDAASPVGEGVRLDDLFAGGNLEALLGVEGVGTAALTLSAGGDEPLSVVVTCRRAQTASGQPMLVGLVQLDSAMAGSPAHRISGARYVQFFDDAPIGIAMLDPDGRVVESNRALRRLTVDAVPEPFGVAFTDLVAADDRAEVARRIAEAQAEDVGETRPPLEVRLEGANDTIVAIYTSSLRKPDGKIDGIILHVIDTTEQKNLEMQFAQSQKMQAIGQLAGGIAHDFNNLLTAMLGFCDLLLMRHQAGDQSFSDIMQIKQNANRAASLVRQLLAFSRRQTLQVRVVDLTDTLSELSHLLRRLIGESIELEMVHGRDLGLIKADPGQIEQVIINLAVNARDAMPEGGRLTIRTANERHDDDSHGPEMMPAGDYVVVEVADTGKGIPKQIIGKIFEPFFSTKEVGAGTGLGLSTVYGIVKQTGGYIFVASDVGHGAVFRIYFPRHADESERRREQAPVREVPADLTGKGTILLVEDEEVVRAFAARALRGKGYVVIEADGAAAALEAVRVPKAAIDLVITDVVMPQMNGPALAREIRKARPDMKIVFISGYAEDAFRGGIDALGDVGFLPKPFSLKQLAAKVKDALDPAAI